MDDLSDGCYSLRLKAECHAYIVKVDSSFTEGSRRDSREMGLRGIFDTAQLLRKVIYGR